MRQLGQLKHRTQWSQIGQMLGCQEFIFLRLWRKLHLFRRQISCQMY